MRIRIEEQIDSFTRGELMLAMLAIDAFLSAPLAKLVLKRLQFTHKFFEVFAIGGVGLSIHRGCIAKRE